MSVVSVKVQLSGDAEIKLPKSLDTEENRALIPVLRHYSVKVHLKKVSTAISNALVRTMMDEIIVKTLECDKDDIKTDDENIMWASVQKSIQSIRLNQDVPKNTRFNLKFINTTAEPQMIRSRDLKTNHKLNMIPFNSTFRIVTVREGKTLEINNIRVEENQGRNYGYGQYSAVSNCGHQPLDVEIYDRGEGTDVFVSNPTEYEINFGTNGNAQPKWILTTACQSIYNRANKLAKELEVVSDKTQLKYTSDIMDINQEDDLTHFMFKGETHTICNLIRYFIYDKHPNIALSNYEITHPTEMNSVYRLISQKPKKIMLEALENIVSMFQSLEKQFDEKTIDPEIKSIKSSKIPPTPKLETD
jgi:DNA-directed RNA polymerase subunit L